MVSWFIKTVKKLIGFPYSKSQVSTTYTKHFFTINSLVPIQEYKSTNVNVTALPLKSKHNQNQQKLGTDHYYSNRGQNMWSRKQNLCKPLPSMSHDHRDIFHSLFRAT